MSSRAFLTECVTPEFLASHYHQRTQPVIDEYHGIQVVDAYRWLEDTNAPETLVWLHQQKQATTAYFQDKPEMQQITRELTALWDYPQQTLPERHGERSFFQQNSGLQQQSVYMMQHGLNDTPRVILDPNTLSQDGTRSVLTTFPNREGTLLAYGVSINGSDWQQVRIRRIDDGYDYAETLHWVRHSLMAWHPNSEGFFYSRYPEPESVAPEDRLHFHRVYFHRVGTLQAEDRLVYEQPEEKELHFHPSITDDGAYLVLHVTRGTSRMNRWYYRELASDGPFLRLLDQEDAQYRFLGNDGPLFFFRTTLDAPRGRLIVIDSRAPEREHWREVIPEREDVLDFAVLVHSHLFVAYLQHLHHVLLVYDCDGHLVRELPMPRGSIAAIAGKPGDRELFLGMTSFVLPMTIYRYDCRTESLEVFRESACPFDPTLYTSEIVFCSSKDGTRIPLSLVHKKGLVLDGTHPVLLHGYGGFANSQLPAFSHHLGVWLARGGVYAVAHVRGGGEYGEEWHQAGMREKKQNVFDDFLAAAEWLIANHYTTSSRLAISGGSNGGLLVAACLIQRPDLFGAVLCRVPLIDMLRYHKLGSGQNWTAEYGNAEASVDHFQFLHAYSPLHQIQPGVAYPPLLIQTAEGDDRVSPGHALKFAAALQAAAEARDRASSPMLLDVQAKAGHGPGKATSQVIEQWSKALTFVFHQLHVDESEGHELSLSEGFRERA